MEEKFVKMKQMYGNLRKEHVDLLKQVCVMCCCVSNMSDLMLTQQSEMTKQVSTLSKEVEDSETQSKVTTLCTVACACAVH